jgi:hypothetical protein
MRSGTEIHPVGRRRISAALAAAIAGALLAIAAPTLAPPAALADGDPASDVLLAQNVFYPYSPGVSASLQKSLNAETAAAAKAHFHIRVALIDSPFDLGVVPEMFGKPQTYARFLDQELGLILGPHPPLLVVMPAGYGTSGVPQSVATAAASLPKPGSKGSNGLAQAAIIAIRKLAASAGHPLGPASAASGAGGGDGSASPVLLVIVAVAAVGIAAGVIVLRRRAARGTAS